MGEETAELEDCPATAATPLTRASDLPEEEAP